MISLSMIGQMADQYRGVIAGWQGHILVVDHRTGQKYHVGPEDTVDLAEAVVIINWRGDDPNGVILPIDSVSIHQHDPEAQRDATS